jgi:hypothetical protein
VLSVDVTCPSQLTLAEAVASLVGAALRVYPQSDFA